MFPYSPILGCSSTWDLKYTFSDGFIWWKLCLISTPFNPIKVIAQHGSDWNFINSYYMTSPSDKCLVLDFKRSIDMGASRNFQWGEGTNVFLRRKAMASGWPLLVRHPVFAKIRGNMLGVTPLNLPLIEASNQKWPSLLNNRSDSLIDTKPFFFFFFFPQCRNGQRHNHILDF